MLPNQETYQNLIKDVVKELSITTNFKLENTYYLDNIKRCRAVINIMLTLLNKKLSEDLYKKIDEIIKYENSKTKVLDYLTLFNTNKMAILKGDITTLKIDCIVNASNSSLLGCFKPGHNCIDNLIHTKAGPRLRLDCVSIREQLTNGELSCGHAIISNAYNLPSKYIIHTVGPIYNTNSTSNKILLSQCYENCLDICKKNKIHSIAFCSISTGEFNFPKKEACEIAINTVNQWMTDNNKYDIKIVFCICCNDEYGFYNSYLPSILLD